MNDVVGYSSQKDNQRILVFHGVFGKIDNEVRKERYFKTHLFTKNEFTTYFREYLYNILNVTKKDELRAKFGEDWTLRIIEGYGDYTDQSSDKVFTIYYDDFEDYYNSQKMIKNNSNTIKKLYDKDKIPSSSGVTNIVNKIAERSNEISFSLEQKKELSNAIPDILINNNIKLEKQDVFDINKIAIEEVVDIGRAIINNDKSYQKILNVKDIAKEDAWQKYFEKYGSYLLFGNVKLNPKECLDSKKTGSLNDDFPDIITCNRYGFLDLIELKRNDMYLFKFDASHNNLVPTSNLSNAISQLNNYLQVIPYAYKTRDSRDKGLQCATGMLMIGDNYHLVRPNSKFKNYCEKYNLDENYINFWAHKELRKLNYSYSYIQVVLYDELIDNLENFINNIK